MATMVAEFLATLVLRWKNGPLTLEAAPAST
jgi:hypothetical protein